MIRHIISFFLASFLALHCSFAQSVFPNSSSSDIRLAMERLNVLGSALYFAAHPDDENTKLIAYLASERKVRTAYLSLTRGDGGQNLIGTEQGIELGLIRTQELLRARGIDGGEQYFSSAFDFGFSKTYDETFTFWQKEDVLREAVWIIRKLRPDVIITRFPPDERGGHGHHQASAILAHEAFIAAADPKKFPEQLSEEVQPWQAKRLLWNTASFMRVQGDDANRLRIDIGQYNPLLGKSYGELSAISRSQHKSQGFGSAATNGVSLETFENVAGEKATDDLFDGIDLSWNRIPGSKAVQQGIKQLLSFFAPDQPQKSIPQLAQIWHDIQKLEDGYWKERKSDEVEQIMVACAGIKVESLTPKLRLVEEQPINFKTEIVVRNPDIHVELLRINDNKIGQTLPPNEITNFDQVLPSAAITQPYWLRKSHARGKFDVDPAYVGYPMSPDLPTACIQLCIADVPIEIRTPIQYRYVDPVRGEVHEYLEVTPTITATAETNNLLIQQNEPKKLQVTFQKQGETAQDAQVDINLSSSGWKVSPEKLTLSFPEGQDTHTETIEITNVAAEKEAQLSFTINGKKLKGIREITYDHIPRQTWFPDAETKLNPITLTNPIKKVGYIMGAGDLVPEALRNMGTAVDILDVNKLSKLMLEQYDAIVFGIRALNMNTRIMQKLPLVYDYIREGGVVLMQYNVNSPLQKELFSPKPAPFTITRARVTEEDAKVEFTDPDDPVLNYPNKITSEDFDGWVQERGLYFAEDIDPAYRTPLAMHDKNEPQHKGSLLVYRMGKGKFAYTSLSFFRQLPAGVAGAHRLFVNLLAKEK